MIFGLGSWRFFLAFLVVISHLWSGMIHGPAAYAVWGFFVLSGFLMTHVLRGKYGFTQEGLIDYARNRFLRIYPAYWIACLSGLVVLKVFPLHGINPNQLNPEFAYPDSPTGWFNTLTLLPIFGVGGGKFVPVAGALSVEIGAYLLMPLLASAEAAAWLGLILSFALNVHYGLTEHFDARYSLFHTSFMAFAVGSLVSHHRVILSRLKMPNLSLLAWCLHGLIWLWHDSWPWTYGLYTSVILSAWVVLSLADNKTRKMDSWLGDLSYPIYLFHTNVAIWLFPRFHGEKRFIFFVISFAATLLVSMLIVGLVDKKINVYKRNRSIAKPASPIQNVLRSESASPVPEMRDEEHSLEFISPTGYRLVVRGAVPQELSKILSAMDQR